MPEPATAEPAVGATTVVEGATAEAAVAEVHERLGPDARILEARRVLRGGVGGFFAREVVQLHAAPMEDRPVDRLLAGADEVPDAVDFATFLRQQLAERSADGGVPAGVEAPDEEADRGPLEPRPAGIRADRGDVGTDADAPGWSTSALLRVGLPSELARSLRVEAPGDDTAWTAALAAALRPTCRPLPSGPGMLVGPHAARIAAAVGVPAARSDRFRAALRGQRWLHLVVGGDGWRALLEEDPLAVSWADPEELPEAIRCAVDLGLVLGYGPLDGRIGRARPLDVALSVRRLIDRR